MAISYSQLFTLQCIRLIKHALAGNSQSQAQSRNRNHIGAECGTEKRNSSESALNVALIEPART
eukprot:7730083-Alexandrium_andersonii.AAC.1